MITSAASERTDIGGFDDAYLAWFSAECESERALRAWIAETGRNASNAYRVYLAALDREEAAARALRERRETAPPAESVPDREEATQR